MPDIAGWIEHAAEHDITLSPNHFRVIDGETTIDWMAPGEWIAAMTNMQGPQ